MAKAHLTQAQFLDAYPVFEPAATEKPALVTAALDNAALETPLDVWEDLATHRHGLLAARFLARSPFGRDARLSKDDGATVYDRDLERLDLSVGAAVTVRTT